MRTLINLIGEQPIPNLLAIKYIKAEKNILLLTDTTKKAAERIKQLCPESELHIVEPYNIDSAVESIEKIVKINDENIFNITGGTKTMSIAAYNVAVKLKSKFIYLQSEREKDQNNKNVLYVYNYNINGKLEVTKEDLPELINLDEYLKAHFFKYEVEGYHKENGILSEGGMFEKAVDEAISKKEFETIAGVRPTIVSKQIEIDLAVRLKGTNNIGILEIKTGSYEGPKKGLDQLETAAKREYAGIYTTKFLVTESELPQKIKNLADEHHIQYIDKLGFDRKTGKLTLDAKNKLTEKLKAKLQ